MNFGQPVYKETKTSKCLMDVLVISLTSQDSRRTSFGVFSVKNLKSAHKRITVFSKKGHIYKVRIFKIHIRRNKAIPLI